MKLHYNSNGSEIQAVKNFYHILSLNMRQCSKNLSVPYGITESIRLEKISEIIESNL